MIRAALIVAGIGRAARRRAWAATLGLTIIGGCWVSGEPSSAKALGSSPTKSSFVSTLHEVQINERAEEPHGLRLISQPVVQFGSGFKIEFTEANFVRRFLRIAFKDGSNWERFGEPVVWFIRQFMADKKVALNFNRECSRPTQVRKIEEIDRAMISFAAFGVLGNAESEPVRTDANQWQFKRDGCSGAEIGSIGGNARRARYTDCETSEYCGENSNDESGKSSDLILVGMDEVADWNEQRAYHGGAIFVGGMIFFVMFAGLYLWVTR
jgi:hypothetical protein